MPHEAEDLTMLLVAEGERLAPALRERLVKHGLHVQDCSRAKVSDTAFVVAPDLVVLAGTAAEDGGLDILEALASRPGTAALPVVLIGDPDRLTERAGNFRHGVVAIIERTASADELARQIADVARGLPERTGEASGPIDAAGVQELVELLAESLRTGILSLTGADGTSARIVLRADRPASEVIAKVVERLRPLAARGGVRYEFHESPTGRLGSLDLGSDDDALVLAELGRCRVLLIEQNPARSDLLAQGLRAHGARVAVADGFGHGLALARELTPDVVIVDGEAVDGWALATLRQIRRDPWLRWASLLVVDAAQLWRDERRPDVPMLAKSLEALVRPDRELTRRVLRDKFVGTRLDVIGPVRTLRALAETKLGLRVRVQHARVAVDVDISDGLIAGASARAPVAKAAVAEGPVALSTLLGLSHARVSIERAEAPRGMNIMSPVDDAIAVAAHEEPAVARSEPPPSMMPPAPPVPSSVTAPLAPGSAAPGPTDVARLVTHLEQLLGELREHAQSVPPPRARVDMTMPMPALPTRAASAAPLPAPVLPELVDAAPPVSSESMAMSRRRVRVSSQRLRAVTPGASSVVEASATPDGAVPAVPVIRAKNRHKTLVGMPIDPRPLPRSPTNAGAGKAAAPTPGAKPLAVAPAAKATARTPTPAAKPVAPVVDVAATDPRDDPSMEIDLADTQIEVALPPDDEPPQRPGYAVTTPGMPVPPPRGSNPPPPPGAATASRSNPPPPPTATGAPRSVPPPPPARRSTPPAAPPATPAMRAAPPAPTAAPSPTPMQPRTAARSPAATPHAPRAAAPALAAAPAAMPVAPAAAVHTPAQVAPARAPSVPPARRSEPPVDDLFTPAAGFEAPVRVGSAFQPRSKLPLILGVLVGALVLIGGGVFVVRALMGGGDTTATVATNATGATGVTGATGATGTTGTGTATTGTGAAGTGAGTGAVTGTGTETGTGTGTTGTGTGTTGTWDPLESTCRHASLSIL